MTEPTTPAAAVPLQFETAELPDTAATRACGACKQPLVERYFDVNGMVACTACKDTLLASLRGGSGFLRFLKAGAFGTVAAALGAGAYGAITELTGYNIGLIAIALGWMVGTAVSLGAERRGGVLYQLLAVAFTYLSLGASMIPEVVREAPADAEPGMTVVMSIIAVFAGPVLVGIEAPISGFIYCIGLWEGWRRNKKPVISVNGPFEVAGPEAAPATLEAAPVHATGT